jgi:hypothetical protein
MTAHSCEVPVPAPPTTTNATVPTPPPTTTNATVPTPSGLSVVTGPLAVGNRTMSLAIKVHPPSNLTSATFGTESMQFRLFDTSNNQTIKHVTYQITVTKESSISTSQRPQLLDFFHTHNGILTLKVELTNGPLTVFRAQDPFLQACVADPGGNILIKGPLLLQGGLYHFRIQIFSIDNDRNIFIPAQAPKFDVYLNICWGKFNSNLCQQD